MPTSDYSLELKVGVLSSFLFYIYYYMLNSEILDIGYIYQITSEDDDKIYYGSTKNWKERLRSHNARNNKCMTMYMNGKKKIKVLNQFYNITREDLQKKEREYIENHNEEISGFWCLNKQVPTQTPKEYHKKRYDKNSLYFAAKQKVYYWENLDKEHARNKKYRDGRKGDTWFCSHCNQLYAWTTRKKHIKSLKHLDSVATATTTQCIPLEHGSIKSTSNSTTDC